MRYENQNPKNPASYLSSPKQLEGNQITIPVIKVRANTKTMHVACREICSKWRRPKQVWMWQGGVHRQAQRSHRAVGIQSSALSQN